MRLPDINIAVSNVYDQTKILKTICSLRIGPIERSLKLRDRKFFSSAQQAGARPRARLATGETNRSWQITRSVICFNVREQSLTTEVQDVCRALEQRFETATGHAPISTHAKFINA